MIVALALMATQGGMSISPDDMASIEKIGAVCRQASAASIETGDARDWLSTIRDTGSEGGLSEDDQTLLLRMCGIYAVAERDAAQGQLQKAKQRLNKPEM